MFDHYELVEFLILQGCLLNIPDEKIQSPLLLAAYKGSFKSLTLLLKAGACFMTKVNCKLVNVKNNLNTTDNYNHKS